MNPSSEPSGAPLLLASKSPRRAELLSQINVEFEQISLDTDETPKENELPHELVVRLACQKAQAGLLIKPERTVLGSDTIVVVDGDILGKPKDFDDSKRMLELLSGRTHQVLSAVSLAEGHHVRSRLSRSDVTFRPVTDLEIERYWATEEPCDKAGSYAIQGLAATFVTHISGSYSGVMGLPLFETAELLAEFDISGWFTGKT